MARSLNKVQLIGNLGADPEVRHLESGVNVANIRIATTETYTDKTSGQKIDKTDWHRVVLWRGLATIAEQYMHKGDQVYVEGKIRNRSYEKDGVTHYITEIYADNVLLLGGKPSSQNNAGTNQNTTSNQPVQNPVNNTVSENKQEQGYTDISEMGQDDDLPF